MTDLIPDGFYLADGEIRVTWFWQMRMLVACDQPIRILGPMCSSRRCETLAEWRVWWPSEDEHGQAKCDRCAEVAARISRVMGFVVPAQRIEVNADVRLLMIADHRAAIAREAAKLESGRDDTDRRFAAMELD